MIPAPFDYERASSIDEACDLLAESGEEAKLLAGGHSLLPLMKLRLAVPSLLIDVGRLEELAYVRDEGDAIAIGALTTHHDCWKSSVLRRALPVVSAVAGQVGDPQVRHRGTIGGSVAHGDAASDLPAALLALSAEYVTTSRRGRRQIPAAEFHRGFLETALEPDELLTEIRVERPLSTSYGFEKLTKRAQDWAIVGAVAARGADGGLRVGLINMGAVPIRAAACEAALGEGASIEEAARLADVGSEPLSDLNGSAEFRRHLARVLVRRSLVEAAR